jgi:hypothetical protein
MRIASGAVVEPSAVSALSHSIEERFLAFREACWAKPMRRLGTAFIWLEHVRHRTRSDVLEFVILLLGIPP